MRQALVANQIKKEKSMSGFSKEKDKETLADKLKSMLTNPVFGGLVFTLSGLTLVVTGL